MCEDVGTGPWPELGPGCGERAWPVSSVSQEALTRCCLELVRTRISNAECEGIRMFFGERRPHVAVAGYAYSVLLFFFFFFLGPFNMSTITALV